MSKSSKLIARAGIVGALYVVLSMTAFPVASGFIQFRVGEALTILAIIFPETAVGLAVGCAVTGLITGCQTLDIIFGSMVTLIAGGLSYIATKKLTKPLFKYLVGGIFPVLMNAFLLPLIWYWCYGQMQLLYLYQVLSLFISQTLAVYGVGGAVFFAVVKSQKPDKKE